MCFHNTVSYQGDLQMKLNSVGYELFQEENAVRLFLFVFPKNKLFKWKTGFLLMFFLTV